MNDLSVPKTHSQPPCFKLPVQICLLCFQGNIVVFALVIYSMLSSQRLRKEPLARRFQRGLKASFVLLPLLGISWSFGVLTMSSDKIVFNYIFAIFNSLQGFLIFVFHCVLNKQVCLVHHTVNDVLILEGLANLAPRSRGWAKPKAKSGNEIKA